MASPTDAPMSRVQHLLSTLPKLRVDLPTGPATTFTCFPKLPTELRIKLWKLASRNQPRTLRLHLQVFLGDREFDSAGHRPQPGLPAILEACQESRHEALTFYTPCKETSIGNTRGETTSSGTIYINFDIDQFDHILHEVSDSFSVVPSHHHNFNTETMRSIKFLIFALGQNWPRGSLSDVEFVEWGSLPQLQEFHMLAEASCHYPVRDKSLDEPLANGVADALGEELLRKEGECQYLRYLELDKEFEMGIIFFTAISFNERTCPQVKSRYFG